MMDQLDMFAPNVRPSDPDTSRAAAMPGRVTLRQGVEAELRRRVDGATDWELTNALGLPERSKPSVAKRRQELGAVDTGLRRRSPDNHDCVVWSLSTRSVEPMTNEGEWMTELMGQEAIGPLVDETEARRLTDLIKANLSGTYELVKAAYHGRAWVALGYSTWSSYCSSEFGSLNLKLHPEERQRVVCEMSAAGMTHRAIADTGVASKQTVDRDIAVGMNHPNRTDTVTGVDGKRYARTKAMPADTKARVEKATSMAAEGYRSRQIAAAIGIAAESFWQFKKRHGITVPADASVGRPRGLDNNRIVRETVESLEGLAMGVRLIGDPANADLDRDQIEGWSNSLSISLTVLTQLRKHLKEMNL